MDTKHNYQAPDLEIQELWTECNFCLSGKNIPDKLEEENLFDEDFI